MADGVAITAGTGTTILTDDTGAGGHAQVMKLAISADGSAVLIPADAANGLDVDVTRLPALPAGTNNIGDVDVLTLPALPAGTNNIGDVDVLTLPALPAGTNNIGDVDVLTLPALVTGAATIGRVGLDPQTSGGLTISRVLSAASTNATSAKASAGQVYGWFLSNQNAAVRYLKLYNKASAPTVGTDTPVMTVAIPAGASANVEYTNGITFATGIAYALTTGVADADTGAVAANEIVVNLLYK